MNLSHKLNIANRIAKSLILNQIPNYAIVYVDGRCNMHCGFCIHAAMDARKSGRISPADWGNVFKKAKSLLHLTITGGEPFVRNDLTEIISEIIINSGVPRVSIKTNGFYLKRIKEYVPTLIKKYPNTEFTLSISLDGPKFIHDKVRNFKGAYDSVINTVNEMKKYRKEKNFFLRLASVITADNKDYLSDFLDETDKWSIDFHEIIMLRDVPDEEQLKLKDMYEQLSKRQQEKSSPNWRKSFNGKIFEKLYKETLKRLEKNKNHSKCVAGTRFVEVFPDGLVRGCEVEKLWDISAIGKIKKHFDIVDVLNSKKAKEFAKIAKNCSCTFECANAISTVYDKKNWPSLL
jgi:MoaA/NifB/PqqE/SkfB family radical SAM enzyme